MNCTSYKCVDLVAEILIRPSALAYVLGNRVSTELLRLSAELAQGTLLGIDMRRTNPIDYIFTKHAFGPICDSARINGHFDIIFLGDEPQIRHTLHGLLIHANKPYDRTGDIIADAAGLLHVKYIDTSDRVQFISNLTTVQSDVLKYVNSTSGTTVSELLDFLKKGTGHAHAVKDIGAAYESLAERKFLYHEVNGGTETLTPIHCILNTPT